MSVSGRQILDWMWGVLSTSVAVMALNVYTGIVTARVLGPEGKGLYNTVMLWTGVAAALASAGIPQAFLLRYGKATGAPHRRAVLTTAAALSLLWPVLISGTMIVFVPRMIAHVGPGITLWTEIALLTVPIGSLVGLAQTLLTAEHSFGWYNVVRIGQTLLFAVPLTVLWLLGRLTPFLLVKVAIGSGLLSGLVILIAAAVFMKRKTISFGRLSVTESKGFVYLASQFYGIGLAGLFNASLDQMLATAWLNARDIGLYAVAASSMSVIGLTSQAFQSVFLPSVVADDAASIVRRTEVGFRRASWLLAFAAVMVVLLGIPVLNLLYGDRYIGAFAPLMGLLPAAVTGGLLGVLYQGCYALKDTRTPLIGEAVGASTGALFLWLLVPRLGIMGAAFATSASYLLDLAVVAVLWGRRPSKTQGLLPRLDDLRVDAVLVTAQASRIFRGRMRRSAA